MLKDTNIDVVCICTPSGMHGENSVAAAKHGKHILCEKPIEITKEKLEKLILTLKECDVKFGCIFQRRYMPQAVAIKKAVDSGRFGKLIIADACLKYYRSPDYYKRASWRGTWALDGGGVLMNQGIHAIDLLQWIAGDVESVYAYTKAFIHDIEVEDTAVALLKFKNGAYGTLKASTAIASDMPTLLSFDCENGTLSLSDTDIIKWINTKDENDKVPEFKKSGSFLPGKDGAVAESSHYEVFEDFVDALIKDRQPYIPPSEGRKAVDIILAIYESARTGKEIWL